MGDILWIGEAPGSAEERAGRVFAGKTGQEFDRHYLPLAGFNRSRIRVTNAIACYPDRPGGKLSLDKAKDRELLESCAAHNLYKELELDRPKLIVAMGAFACRALDPEIDLELQHGIPVETRWGTVFPMYHPAGGIHSPKSMLYIRTDWVRLRKYIKERLYLPEDEYEGAEDYEELIFPESVDRCLKGRAGVPLACDTESYRDGRPFCLSFSILPGTGYLIRGRAALDSFQRHLDRWTGPILFHNWLYDWTVTEKMGLRIPTHLVRDTMVRAYHLGNLPQGLKALAYRELGMNMLDFDDLVSPHSLPLVLDYYRNMCTEDWPTPEEQLVRGEDGKWKLYQPQNLRTKLKRLFTDWSKSPDTVDLFERWGNWQDYHPMIEERLGPFPGKCISYAWEADREATIRYASRDSDAVIRLWPRLQHITRQVRRKPQQDWGDAAAKRNDYISIQEVAV